jgi:NADH-quinone oxidoreductase subunit J
VEAIVFFACAAAVLTGALGVVLGRNPVHCALFLLLTLVSVAVLFLQLNAALVAAIQIVVYASATGSS